MQAQYLSGDQEPIDYTPDSAVAAGDVVVTSIQFGFAPLPIAAGEKGTLYTAGIYRVVKATGALGDRDPVSWDASGNPLGGVMGSGAAGGSGVFMGPAIGDAGSSDETVDVQIQPGIGYALD